jgi:hypothetical protein
MKAYVVAPKGYVVLGIVRMGIEFGILATNETGIYVRVNGSTIQELTQQAVEGAIRAARGGEHMEPSLDVVDKAVKPQPNPVVTIRKRRILSLPT